MSKKPVKASILDFDKNDIRYMKKACIFCDKSNCEIKSSAIAVKNGKIIQKSHNEIFQTEVGIRDKPEREVSLHAEAVMMATYGGKGVSIKNSTIYCTRYPCLNCARMIIKAGVKKIYYMSDLYTTGNQAEELFKSYGIPVIQIKESVVWSN